MGDGMNEHITEAVKEWKVRHKAYQLYGDYFHGRHQLKFTTPDWVSKYAKEVVANAVLAIRENLCPTVVSVFTDAIRVEHWGDNTDATVAESYGLPRHLGFLKRESWRCGDAFSLVWPDAAGKPRAIFQKAQLMVPHVDELNDEVLDRCAKVWRDGQTKHGRINIYYTDRVDRWETVNPIPDNGNTSWNIGDMPEDDRSWRPCEQPTIRHTFGAVPVCWYKLNADDPASHGTSILNDVIPLQDGLNSSLAHLLVNQEAYSRPFWYLLNFKDPTSAPNPFLLAQQAVSLDGMVTNGGDTIGVGGGSTTFDRTRQSIITYDGSGPFGQLDPPDLTRLITVQDAFKLKIAGVVGIPPYLMQAEIGNVPSGAALNVLSERRVARITSWEEDNTPALRGLKQLLGMNDDSPIAWASPISLSKLEKLEIALNMKTLGYSLEDILTWLDESDVKGMVARAEATARANAEATALTFMGVNRD